MTKPLTDEERDAIVEAMKKHLEPLEINESVMISCQVAFTAAMYIFLYNNMGASESEFVSFIEELARKWLEGNPMPGKAIRNN